MTGSTATLTAETRLIAAAGAIAGPMLESYVVAEILKNYAHRLRQAPMFFYRDRDGKEIDVLLVLDGRLLAIEVKLAATPHREWRNAFAVLDRLAIPSGSPAVACRCTEPLPLDATTWAMSMASDIGSIGVQARAEGPLAPLHSGSTTTRLAAVARGTERTEMPRSKVARRPPRSVARARRYTSVI